MQLHTLVRIIVGILVVQGALAYNTRSETEKEQCEVTCDESCFPNEGDSLQRMGCFEKCMAEGVDQFTCPGPQAFLSDVAAPSRKLQEEVGEFFTRFTDIYSSKNMEGLASLFTENSTILFDHQKPVIGRDARIQSDTDFFIANPDIDSLHYEPTEFGEEQDIVWANGEYHNYDKQDQKIGTVRFMALLKRVDGELQEFLEVNFSVEII